MQPRDFQLPDFLPLKIIKNFYPPTTSEIASGPMNVCDINQLIIMLCHMTGEHIRFGQIWNLQACSSIEGFRDFLKSKSRKYLKQGETASCNTRFSLETWYWLGNFSASIFIKDKTENLRKFKLYGPWHSMPVRSTEQQYIE